LNKVVDIVAFLQYFILCLLLGCQLGVFPSTFELGLILLKIFCCLANIFRPSWDVLFLFPVVSRLVGTHVLFHLVKGSLNHLYLPRKDAHDFGELSLLILKGFLKGTFGIQVCSYSIPALLKQILEATHSFDNVFLMLW